MNDKGKYSYNYLISKGLTPVAAAGIVGNLVAESGLDTRIKGTADDKGSVGIAQWHSERKEGLMNFAKNQGKNYDSLNVQLDYILHELNQPEYKDTFSSLQSAKTAAESTNIFMNKYERPAEWAKKKSIGLRLGSATEVLTGEPYKNVDYVGEDYTGTGNVYEGITPEQQAYFDAQVSQYHNIKEAAKSKEDVEADKAKAEITQKQQEQAFMEEMQQRTAQKPQREQEQQAPQFDGSAYRLDQQQMPTVQYSQLPETAFKDGGEKGIPRVSPEARSMGDVGVRFGNNFSTSIGANLRDKNIRTGASYNKGNFSTDINYTKGLDNTSSFSGNASYNPGKYNIDLSYDKGPEGNRNLSAGAGYNGENLSGNVRYNQDNQDRSLSGDVRYGAGNFSGSLGTNFTLGKDFNPNVRGDIGYQNRNLSTSIGAQYNKETGLEPNLRATYTFQDGGEIEGRRFNPKKKQRARLGYFAEGGTSIEDEGTSEVDPIKKLPTSYKEIPEGVVRETITNPNFKGVPGLKEDSKVVPTIEQLMQLRPDLKKDQGIYYGTGEDTTYVSPGGQLDEVVVKSWKKSDNIEKFKRSSLPQEYSEQPNATVKDMIPGRAQLNMPVTKNEEDRLRKEILRSSAVQSKISAADTKSRDLEIGKLKKDIDGRSMLEDAIENKEINLDLSKYKTKEDVKNLQRSLVQKGYNLNPEGEFENNGIDGKLGNATKKAMTQYNQHNSDSGYASIKEGLGELGNCTETQCSEYMQNELYRNVQPDVAREEWTKKTGLHGNAWEIGKNIVDSGGAKVKSKEVKAGDVVTMFTGGLSDYQKQANAAGTGTTHTGLIDKVNPDGSYYVLHNVHDKNYVTGTYTGVEYRDLVKDGQIVSGGMKRGFAVRGIFRPDYKEINLGEKKIVRDDLKIKINPNKEKLLEGEDYKSITSTAKEKLQNSFIKPLNDPKNKKVFSKSFNLGDDEYQSLAKATLGILGQETGYGTSAYYTTGVKPAIATIANVLGIKSDEVSKGAGRLKYETNFGEDDLTEIGVTRSNFNDEDKASLTTMHKLATDYKRFLKKGYNKKDAIYRAITVYNSSLGHVSNGKKIGDWAKDYDVDYTNKVLNYGSIFDVTDDKKSYKTATDELLTQPNVFKWRKNLEKQKKI